MALQVVCVGLGHLGRMECQLLDGMDGVVVVGGSDPNPDAREAFEDAIGVPAYDDLDDLLGAVEPDAATVVSPHTLHYAQVATCLDAGLDVHVEKPMVTDLKDAVALVDRVAGGDRVLQVGYQRHFDERYRELRRLVDERVGRPRMAACSLEQDWLTLSEGGWRLEPSLSGGGQLYDSGSHLLDALLWCTDSRPGEVAAVTDPRDREVDVDSAIAATLRPNEGTAPITASVGVTGDGTTGPDVGEALRIYGTEGSVEYDGGTITVSERGRPSYRTTPEAPTFRELTRRKLAAFVGAVRGEREVAVPATFGLQVTALTEAAYVADERRETVDAQDLIEAAGPT